MASFSWPASGGGVPTYANAAALPASASDGSLAITLDTHYLYEFEQGTGWVILATPSDLRGRSGVASISNATASVSVTFSSTLGTSSYAVAWSIKNTVDSADDLVYLSGIITAQSATGFTVTFNAPANSANYSLEYEAALYV